MYNALTNNKKSAFSLVELSIVLVILGLLVGGVLSGQSLIRAAELRSVTKEYQGYATAIGTFRDKYFALPGDFGNATAFWGAETTCPSTSGSTPTTTATCNGNGNGAIELAATTSNEVFGFWEHLGRAGLIEGSYNGAANNATYSSTAISTAAATTNTPRGKLANTTWSILSIGTVGVGSAVYFDSTYGNAFFFGGGTVAGTPTAVLRPEEAWNIDLKMDDGAPASGSVLSLESQGSATVTAASAGCSTLASSTTVSLTASAYTLVATGANCSLIFKSGF